MNSLKIKKIDELKREIIKQSNELDYEELKKVLHNAFLKLMITKN